MDSATESRAVQLWLPRCWFAGGDTEPNGGVVAARHHRVVAGALEVVKLPIEGAVMRVAVDVAESSAGCVAAPLAVLDLADLVLSTGQRRANHLAVGLTPALASAVLAHRVLAFLQAEKRRASAHQAGKQRQESAVGGVQASAGFSLTL